MNATTPDHYKATIYCEDGSDYTEDIAAESYTEAEAIAMELAQDYEDVWNVYVRLCVDEKDR